jgi:RHS repeat-associated protein
LPGDSFPAVTYSVADHIGSCNVVFGAEADFVNREEYTPYGETTGGSFAKKLYRFSGKERDEESGVYYYGARYCAPWLCRWLTPDPLGLVAGLNPYQYCSNNPLVQRDDSGLQDETATNVETRPFKVNIDEIVPVAKGGSPTDPANKDFKEDLTNSRHKQAHLETTSRIAPPKEMVSLAAAKAEGSYAFREASTGMFAKSFDQTKELKEIASYAERYIADKYKPMTDRDTANTANRIIREIISGSRKTPATIADQVSLVREAFTVSKIDYKTWELSGTGVKVGKLPAGGMSGGAPSVPDLETSVETPPSSKARPPRLTITPPPVGGGVVTLDPKPGAAAIVASLMVPVIIDGMIMYVKEVRKQPILGIPPAAAGLGAPATLLTARGGYGSLLRSPADVAREKRTKVNSRGNPRSGGW